MLYPHLYYGWYTHFSQMDEARQFLKMHLDALHERFQKPVLLSEFGANTLPGMHAQPPEMFTEEYQADFLARYIETAERKPYVIDCHVWNLCDFKTGQAVYRVGGMNYKGVFTRDRRPKLAAHRLRELWNQ
ncbi:MAG: hypothetical protein JXA78_07600 [Anaerolineales bacterium]|nr:hypothetical protein [Anaerolineales bacterium]